jgi:hypothetical protein
MVTTCTTAPFNTQKLYILSTQLTVFLMNLRINTNYSPKQQTYCWRRIVSSEVRTWFLNKVWSSRSSHDHAGRPMLDTGRGKNYSLQYYVQKCQTNLLLNGYWLFSALRQDDQTTQPTSVSELLVSPWDFRSWRWRHWTEWYTDNFLDLHSRDIRFKSLDTGYPEVFVALSLPIIKCWVSVSIMPWSLPSKSQFISYRTIRRYW